MKFSHSYLTEVVKPIPGQTKLSVKKVRILFDMMPVFTLEKLQINVPSIKGKQ